MIATEEMVIEGELYIEIKGKVIVSSDTCLRIETRLEPRPCP